jgi:hypothetical protein
MDEGGEGLGLARPREAGYVLGLEGASREEEEEGAGDGEGEIGAAGGLVVLEAGVVDDGGLLDIGETGVPALHEAGHGSS